jgi:small-conductance mechanosensitive channel
MDRLDSIFSAIKDFLSYHVIDTDEIDITLGTLLSIIIALFVVSFVLKLIHKLVTKKLPVEDKNKFVSVFSFLRYILYIFVVIVVLHTSGVNLTVLLTASAALFVGLGFALQYLFQDIISGVMMIMDQSLHVGDIIEVDGKVGRVFEIRLRNTRALTRDDKVVVIPNHIFLTDSIYNYTQNHNMTRESVKIGVAYGSDVQLVTQILIDLVNNQQGILKKPKPFVTFDDFGDSALMFSVNFYITDSFRDPMIKSDIRYAIDARFREKNVTIPFPQRDVHIYQHSPFQHSKVENSSKGREGLTDD